MKRKSLLTLALSLSLVAVVSVGSTLAYLSTKTDVVTNTFTVGKYEQNALVLNEAPVNYIDGDWKEKEGERVTILTYDKLLPGSEVFKDPTVQLTEGIDSYVFVHIVGVDDLEQEGMNLDRKTDSLGGNWIKLKEDGTRDTEWNKDKGLIDGYYVYKNVVSKLTLSNPEDDSLSGQLFRGLKVKHTLTETDMNDINGKTIKIKAAAVQADGIEETNEKKAEQIALKKKKSGLNLQ